MTIPEVELAKRLRRAREAVGVTQEAAAAAIGLTRPAIGQVEAGKRSVSGLELDRLATLYGVDVAALLASPAAPLAFFRKGELADSPDVAEALRDALRIGRELAHLERLLGVERAAIALVAYELPLPATKRQATMQGVEIAEAERRRLGLGDEPIADIVDLLELNGVRAALIEMPDRVAGVMLVDDEAGMLVAVNRNDHVLRRSFSLAHEYAHALFDRAGGVIVSRMGETDLKEVRANAFAASFLMPEAAVRRRLAALGKDPAALSPSGSSDDDRPNTARGRKKRSVQLHDVAILANAFGTSRLAMLVRLRSLRLLPMELFETLRKADQSAGETLERLLDLPRRDHGGERRRFQRRYSRLALEAHARSMISRVELAQRLQRDVGMSGSEVEALVVHLGSCGFNNAT